MHSHFGVVCLSLSNTGHWALWLWLISLTRLPATYRSRLSVPLFFASSTCNETFSDTLTSAENKSRASGWEELERTKPYSKDRWCMEAFECWAAELDLDQSWVIEFAHLPQEETLYWVSWLNMMMFSFMGAGDIGHLKVVGVCWSLNWAISAVPSTFSLQTSKAKMTSSPKLTLSSQWQPSFLTVKEEATVWPLRFHSWSLLLRIAAATLHFNLHWQDKCIHVFIFCERTG